MIFDDGQSPNENPIHSIEMMMMTMNLMQIFGFDYNREDQNVFYIVRYF